MHTLSIPEIIEKFKTDPAAGLDEAEARRRLLESGPNELEEKPRRPFLALLFDQFKNFLIVILLVAAGISIALGEYVDAAAVVAIVALNAVLGLVQEARAEKALAALKKLSAPNAMVIRDGRRLVVPARELVPGDLVALEAGNNIPADVRLVESANLKAEEASLTGESLPVNKSSGMLLPKDASLGDRRNMGYLGTVVTYGRGAGVVVATGMDTQIGKIAAMLQGGEEGPTPLQRKLAELGKKLGLLALGVCAVILVIGLIRDTDLPFLFSSGLAGYIDRFRRELVDLFMTAVGLAIAAVPEGLPAVVTVCLALGMQHMVRRHALVRKLPAVETLGCATVICTDKTGTLTQNAMTVTEVRSGDRALTVTGDGYEPRGEFRDPAGTPVDAAADPGLSLLLHAFFLCNDARLERTEEGGVRLVGDPTEGALVAAAQKGGLDRDALAAACPRVAEVPFDSERKRMATLHRLSNPAGALAALGSPFSAFVKGGPDLLLACCSRIWLDGRIAPLTDALRERILEENAALARQALRVLGAAVRPLARIPDPVDAETVETDLVFLGLAGMLDPARPEAAVAVATARTAGIRTIMVTGDYKDTAAAIAGRIGILAGGKVVTGAEVDRMSAAELEEEIERVDVFARVSPEHKVRIVEALQARGHVAAMTGDGVNDAPALKRADIGVAMGITGTDVTKETADIVLTDDNFASIVAAVEQGRIIFSNIRKFVNYLLTCNVGEILIILTSMIAGLPLPFTALMLLILNLVTDGAPAVALGLERGDPDIMRQPPRGGREPVVTGAMAFSVLLVALAFTGAVVGAYLLALARYPGNLPAARATAFATLVASELLRVFTARSEHRSFLKTGFAGNRWLLAAVGGSFAVLLLLVYVPFLSQVLDIAPLSALDWAILLPFSLIAPMAAELVKIPGRLRLKRR